MDMLDYHTIMPLVGMILSVGGAIITVQKIIKNFRVERAAEQKEREKDAIKILDNAKEEIALIEAKLEAKIEIVKAELKTLEFTVSKDFEHLKETYSNEIKVLSEKIQNLRDELREQHVQLLDILSNLIKK